MNKFARSFFRVFALYLVLSVPIFAVSAEEQAQAQAQVMTADIHQSTSDLVNIELAKAPSSSQMAMAERLVVGVLSGSISRQEFDQLCAALPPVVLHIALYYISLREVVAGNAQYEQSRLKLYAQGSRVMPYIKAVMTAPALVKSREIRSFHSAYPESEEGVGAMLKASLKDLLLQPYTKEA